ncbi:hypothetical protein J2Y69_001515 [Microbacterium resistens]|uniref:Antitoxin n=1 Tax=Microbacterium resistens TaxID=156977 RepID=A0ABU1SBI4_9MICO|nr:hypothetical protein [Microbacterium resistens]MDR6866916.1 hypothetical protein [Microbacterium resistens]
MNTTIKVSVELRDRLMTQASRDGHSTIGLHLEHLADAADRQWRLESLRSAIAESSPAEIRAYADETAAWERAELTDAAS